jgi:hypothetical protein
VLAPAPTRSSKRQRVDSGGSRPSLSNQSSLTGLVRAPLSPRSSWAAEYARIKQLGRGERVELRAWASQTTSILDLLACEELKDEDNDNE